MISSPVIIASLLAKLLKNDAMSRPAGHKFKFDQRRSPWDDNNPASWTSGYLINHILFEVHVYQKLISPQPNPNLKIVQCPQQHFLYNISMQITCKSYKLDNPHIGSQWNKEEPNLWPHDNPGFNSDTTQNFWLSKISDWLIASMRDSHIKCFLL